MSVEERKENLFQFSKEFELFVRYGLYKHRYGLSTLTTVWGTELGGSVWRNLVI
jgi:hypothetical protein